MNAMPETKNWQAKLSLVVSGIGIVYFIGQTLILGMVWLFSLLLSEAGFSQGVLLGLLLWSSTLSVVLLLPTFLISLSQLRGKSIPRWLDTSRPIIQKLASWSILVWPLFVLLGWLISGSPQISAFLLGPINVLVAGIPVLWIYHTAQRKLYGGSQIRKWRIFGFSLTVMPLVVIIVEMLAILALVILGGIWVGYQLTINPQLEQELIQIFERIMANVDNPDALMQQIEPYLTQSDVVLSVLAVLAGIMPLIEEIFKPIALWALAGRKISPQEGFVGGLLCGAGFALMENVLYFTAVATPEDWLFMAIGRAGTGVLHMLASGLVGWGLARAWRDRRWLFLGLITLGAVLLHGLWNAFAFLTGIAPIYLGLDMTSISFSQTLLFNAPVIFLLILSAIGMILINRYFQKRTLSGEVLSDDFIEDYHA